MIDLDPQIQRQVSVILQAYITPLKVLLVGSRARGPVKRYADIDLLLMNEEPLSPRTRALVKTAFEESDLPYKVDLLEWFSLTPSFRVRLLNDGVPWVYRGSAEAE